MKGYSENRGVSLRTVIFHISTSYFSISSHPFLLGWKGTLLMIPSTSPPFPKRPPNLKDNIPRSCLTRLLKVQPSIDPSKRINLLPLLLQQFKKLIRRRSLPIKAHDPPIHFLQAGNVIPYFMARGQQKIIMGISMSESQEIRRLKLHDLQYKERSVVKFHSSAPGQFRGNENQQVDNKSKNKQVITEPSSKVRQQQPESRVNQTLNYELDLNLQEVDPRGKARGKGTQRLRESNAAKENSDNDVLRVSKVKADNDHQANPQTMRSRKVKIGKK